MMKPMGLFECREVILIVMLFNIVMISHSFIISVLLLKCNGVDVVVRVRVIEGGQHSVLMVLHGRDIVSIVVGVIKAVMGRMVVSDVH